MGDIDTISIFLTQNIGDIDIDIDILDYSPLWATHNHYRQQVVDDVNIIP